MANYRINCLGDAQDRRLAFIDTPPEDLGGFDYKITLGEPIRDLYPDDARIYLQARSPGIQLADFIGNTLKYLIVSSKIKTIIEAHEIGETEFLPFVLYNHRQRVHSTDYWIINPIGTFDCLNRSESEIRYLNDDPAADIVKVRSFVFDSRKIDGAPDLFRIPEDPQEYFISERLGSALHRERCSNVRIFKVDQKP